MIEVTDPHKLVGRLMAAEAQVEALRATLDQSFTVIADLCCSAPSEAAIDEGHNFIARAAQAEESSVEAQPSGYSTPIDVGIGAPSPVECQWPAGLMFGFHDEPGEHDPCYVIMPGGAMLPFNHHAEPGVDIARARFVQIACNAMLAGRTEAGWQPRPGAVVHDVKCWPEFFKAIADGRKPWELRNNDRGYQAGDIMRIREWEPGAQSYTGAELWRGVPFVLHGAGDWLPVGKCIMSLADYAPAEARGSQPAEGRD